MLETECGAEGAPPPFYSSRYARATFVSVRVAPDGSWTEIPRKSASKLKCVLGLYLFAYTNSIRIGDNTMCLCGNLFL